MRASPGAFDIVASSDTLNYFGDLREVLVAAGTALRPGGTLFFTLERAVDEALAPGGFRLNPHGRFSHTPGYVRATIAAAGLQLLQIADGTIRCENADPVPGLVVTARRG